MTEILNPNTQAYLKSIGLDPLRISVDGITEQGYFEFRFDEDGDWIPNEDHDERRAFPMEWPDNFDYEQFQDARQKDGIA